MECLWVADVPPRETSSATKSEEKRMFSQAIRDWTISDFNCEGFLYIISSFRGLNVPISFIILPIF